MKKISIFTFLLFVLSAGIYVFQEPNKIVEINHYAPTYQEHSATIKQNLQKNELNVQHEQTAFSNQHKAYIEIKKDEKTGEEKAIVHLPMGKRLFNEENLKEISRDATI